MPTKKVAAKTVQLPKVEYTQINVKRCPKEYTDKIRVMAAKDKKTINDVYILALKRFVEAFEAEHGTIHFNEKGKGLERL